MTAEGYVYGQLSNVRQEWDGLRVFMRHKLVILSRPFYNPHTTTHLIFPDERCEC